MLRTWGSGVRQRRRQQVVVDVEGDAGPGPDVGQERRDGGEAREGVGEGLGGGGEGAEVGGLHRPGPAAGDDDEAGARQGVAEHGRPGVAVRAGSGRAHP